MSTRLTALLLDIDGTIYDSVPCYPAALHAAHEVADSAHAAWHEFGALLRREQPWLGEM